MAKQIAFWKNRGQTSAHVHGRTSLAEETAPRKKSDYWFAFLATVSVLVLVEWFFNSKDDSTLDVHPNQIANFSNIAATQDVADSTLLFELLASELNQPDLISVESVDDQALLLQASDAVVAEDHLHFANTMRLLGTNAMQALDIDSAAVYLAEALAVYEELEDDLGIASVELLRAELDLHSRAQARRAAIAYDQMQVARWKAARGYFHDAIDTLNIVVDENIQLNRYGGAAAAYETLYNGYTNHGQVFEAQEVGIELVKLYAASGRALKAQSMLNTLQDNGLDLQTVSELTQLSIESQREFEESILQMGQARDYRQLYNYFINAGDPVRAWQFRLKAQQSLRGVDKRAMYRRQSGVLALLYNSNDNMEAAEHSLVRANELFIQHDKSALSEKSVEMLERIY